MIAKNHYIINLLIRISSEYFLQGRNAKEELGSFLPYITNNIQIEDEQKNKNKKNHPQQNSSKILQDNLKPNSLAHPSQTIVTKLRQHRPNIKNIFR